MRAHLGPARYGYVMQYTNRQIDKRVLSHSVVALCLGIITTSHHDILVELCSMPSRLGRRRPSANASHELFHI